MTISKSRKTLDLGQFTIAECQWLGDLNMKCLFHIVLRMDPVKIKVLAGFFWWRPESLISNVFIFLSIPQFKAKKWKTFLQSWRLNPHAPSSTFTLLPNGIPLNIEISDNKFEGMYKSTLYHWSYDPHFYWWRLSIALPK